MARRTSYNATHLYELASKGQQIVSFTAAFASMLQLGKHGTGVPIRPLRVAKELRMSCRTLQRRITAERTTFRRLISDAWRELARSYLSHPALELGEVAVESLPDPRD